MLKSGSWRIQKAFIESRSKIFGRVGGNLEVVLHTEVFYVNCKFTLPMTLPENLHSNGLRIFGVGNQEVTVGALCTDRRIRTSKNCSFVFPKKILFLRMGSKA